LKEADHWMTTMAYRWFTDMEPWGIWFCGNHDVNEFQIRKFYLSMMVVNLCWH